MTKNKQQNINMRIGNICFFLLLPFTAFAGGGAATTSEILNANRIVNTECSTRAFTDALTLNAGLINESDSQEIVRDWIYSVMQSPETLGDVLSCPEIINAADTDTIKFMPIQYTFPGGREIVINYETQPKILNQHFLLATKTELPTDDPNPDVSSTDPTATWVNTDPAWYGIMVVQSGALDKFVGPGLPNVVSMDYIQKNINTLYPRDSDGVCSTLTGIGAKVHNSTVHHVIREHTAKHDGDKNNYYIAGARDLRWISWAEIAVDVGLTIATFGASAAATGTFKATRAAQIMGKIGKNLKRLTKIDKVKDYIRASSRVHTITKKFEQFNKFEQSLRNVEKLENALAKTAKNTKKYDQILDQLNAARKLHADNALKIGHEVDAIKSTKDLDKLNDLRKTGDQEIKAIRETMEQLARTDPNVAEYVKEFDSLKDVAKYSKDLRALKKARTGNVFQRTWQGAKNIGKSIKTANTGEKTLNNAAKVARKGARTINKLEKAHIDDVAKSFREISKIEKDLGRATKGTKQYETLVQELATAKKLHADKIAKLGPLGSRVKSLKDLDALRGLNTTSRHSIRSANIRDWLYHSTRRNAARITKATEEIAALSFVLGFIGDLYDKTDASSDKFTSGIQMKPYLLLSADNLDGEYDNVVNYGMWMMWTGDSFSPEDDDAAYLLATDFAQKFYQDLIEYQDETGRVACDVDIYVVRPIIRNPDRESQSLYWLFMNDVPWSTRDVY